MAASRSGIGLLNHLIRPLQERRWDRQAERPGGLEVDDQLEFRRLLDWQVARVGSETNQQGPVHRPSGPRHRQTP
jgi:hypothetical protein